MLYRMAMLLMTWVTTQIFVFFIAFHIFVVGNIDISNLVHRSVVASPSMHTTLQTVPERGVVTSCDLF